jgi:hypothetical protein
MARAPDEIVARRNLARGLHDSMTWPPNISHHQSMVSEWNRRFSARPKFRLGKKWRVLTQDGQHQIDANCERKLARILFKHVASRDAVENMNTDKAQDVDVSHPHLESGILEWNWPTLVAARTASPDNAKHN